VRTKRYRIFISFARTRAGGVMVKGVDKRLTNKPLFGVYFITDKPGTVHVGDDVCVLA
jgi:hypothetical protein